MYFRCQTIIVVNIFYFFFSFAAQQLTTEEKINTTDFYDCSHHWYDINDGGRIIDPLPNQNRYKETEITKIADNILLFQKNNGGWPKNYDMLAILTDEQRLKVEKSKNQKNTTFDNGATYTHIEYLAQAYSITKVERYKEGCLKGIDFMLTAQYKNGGWPQFYPERKGYSKYITFNDGAMIGIMTVFQNILNNKPYYDFIDTARRQKIKMAFQKGIDCILNCQIKENDKLTVWCQQHDNLDLRPQNARTFEPASKCSQESAEIVGFLMSIENPNTRIIQAIEGAIAWFRQSQITGIKVETVKGPRVKFKYHTTDIDRIVKKDSTAPPIWTRYYELGTNRPMFCNRNQKIVYSLAEVDRERRTGYSWYNYVPQEILKKYSTWQKNLNSNDN